MGAWVDILPDSATSFELALAETLDPLARLASQFDLLGPARAHPPSAFLPFLIWELGLNELEPFITSPYDLIDKGVRWQRLRGSQASMLMALGFIGYGGTADDAPARRRRWHNYTWLLDRVRDTERHDLKRIVALLDLSAAKRSVLTRVVAGYDIRAFETGFKRTSAALWGESSGVILAGIAPKFSFGRRHDVTLAAGQADLTSLGTWIEPASASPLWADMHQPWATANYRWAIDGAQARRDTILAALAPRTVHVRLRDASGAIIGHCRMVTHPVAGRFDGEYTHASGRWTTRTTTPTALLLRARTPFAAGAGATVSSISLVFDGAPTDAARPGAQWLGPAGLSGGHELYATPASIALGETVREIFTFVLRI